MNTFNSIVIGFIQGVTEFLPISSSGHMLVLSDVFNLTTPSLNIDLVAHLGSLFAVLCFFGIKSFKEIQVSGFEYEKFKSILFRLFIASIPIGFIGYLFKDSLDTTARTLVIVGSSFIFSGLFLIFSSYINNIIKDKDELFGIRKVIFIGLFQTFAIFPGVSRSGMTISSGMLIGINKKKAVEFSFLLSIPVILGANIFQMIEMFSSSFKSLDWMNLFLVFLVSLIISLITINFTLKLAEKIKFWLFGVYGIIFGVFTLILQLL